jgi:hypothetical protein
VTDALRKIEEDFEAFSDLLSRCRSADVFKRADWMDAYGRLVMVWDRYWKERALLTSNERTALQKVFENDAFIKGLSDLRQIGQHVIKRGRPVIRTVHNAPIELDFETSARSAFAGRSVRVPDVDGKTHRIDHEEMLLEAERRIRAALIAARGDL